MKHFFLYWLAGLFLFACTDSAEQAEVPAAGEPVSMSIHLSAAPMQTAEPNAETRAVSDKLPDEQTIHQAWLLQFNGTAAASTLVAVPQKLTMDAAGNTDVSLQAGTGTHRVYILANVDEATVNTLTAGTTLSAFEAKVFPCGAMTVETMASQGLPMSAYKDIDMATGLANQSFELMSRMARVAFGWTLPTNLGEGLALTLQNLPDGMTCKPDLAITSDEQGLSGVDYQGTLDIPITGGSPVVFYVPENLAGVNSSITKETDRSAGIASSNNRYATYFLFETGKEASNRITVTTYGIVLGTDLATRMGDLNVKGNYAYQVSVDIKGNNSLNDQRVWNTVYENCSVDATGKPATANCYMLTDQDKIYHYIDATVMGNGATTPAHTKGSVDGDYDFPAITPVPLVPVSAEVLWESQNETDASSCQGLIAWKPKLFHGKLLFGGGGDGLGNAVIAVRDASGTILWSWHIWVTDQEPKGIPLNPITDGAGFTVSGMQMMDRNLGAFFTTGYNGKSVDHYDYGCYYQWGRKDPFPGASGDEVNSWFPTTHNENWKDATDGTPEKAVANPMTYYKYGYGTADWTVRNDNLWGAPLTRTVSFNGSILNTNAGTKSIYDPCPIGWKVMPAYTLAMATTENSVPVKYGRNFYKPGTTGAANSDLIIPFAGKQSGVSKDDLSYVGIRGYLQSSSVVGEEQLGGDLMNSMTFKGDGVFIDSNRKAEGLSVRCVKE